MLYYLGITVLKKQKRLLPGCLLQALGQRVEEADTSNTTLFLGIMRYCYKTH